MSAACSKGGRRYRVEIGEQYCVESDTPDPDFHAEQLLAAEIGALAAGQEWYVPPMFSVYVNDKAFVCYPSHILRRIARPGKWLNYWRVKEEQ